MKKGEKLQYTVKPCISLKNKHDDSQVHWFYAETDRLHGLLN